MENGISLYLGLDNSFAENKKLIEDAAHLGIRRLFTSFHIPEIDPLVFKKELRDTIHTARQYDMEIISDVSPKTLELLDVDHFSLASFHFLGITTVRLDFGYSPEQVADFSHNPQHIKIQLNASTITPAYLQQLVDLHANFHQIEALHNFYPRENTGLSEETLVRKTRLLHKLGIKTSAFVPSQYRRRGPLYRGLPTLEMHRDADVDFAARHLIALGIDSVFIGDSLPNAEELSALSSLRDDTVVIKIKLLTNDPVQKELLSHTFTSRIDEAQDAIRAQESRPLLKGIIEPENNISRPYGAVTLDNQKYLRYMGELQIVKRPQPADERVNVVAKIDNDECHLLPYIVPGRKFAFKIV